MKKRGVFFLLLLPVLIGLAVIGTRRGVEPELAPEPLKVTLAPSGPVGGEGVLLRAEGRPGSRFRVVSGDGGYAMYGPGDGTGEIYLPLDIEASGPVSLAVVETGPAGLEREGRAAFEIAPRPVRVVRLGAASLRMRRDQPGIREQQEAVHAALNRRSDEKLWRTPFIPPLEARVSAEFAVKRVRDDFVSYHRGVDFAAPVGTPVRALNDGMVVLAGRDFNIYGNLLVVDHGQGVVSCYFHLDRLLVESGRPVSRGEVIAEVGNTGWSSGPHLHLGVYLQGRAVDPLWFIPFTGKVLTGDDDEES